MDHTDAAAANRGIAVANHDVARAGTADKFRCDNPSFDDIYDELFPAVFRYVRLRVRGSEVEDVTAEVMVRIWRSLGSYAGRGSLKAWAFSVAAHTVADYYRRDGKIELAPLSEGLAGTRDFADDMALALTVSEVMTRLSEPQASVIQLRLVEGLDADETASLLGTSREAVDSLLYRARKKFRSLYARAAAGGEV